MLKPTKSIATVCKRRCLSILLNLVSLFLQNVLSKTKILAKIRAKKCNILSKFPLFAFCFTSDLGTKPPFCTFWRSIWCLARRFSPPQKPLFSGKKPLFTPLFSPKTCNSLIKFWTKDSFSICKMQHFVLRFAAFYLAFCCILPCVLHELALRFVGDSTAFCMS